MWFIPLSPGFAGSWFPALIGRLLQNDKGTLALMGPNPFADKPPTWIRGTMYLYRFATHAEKRATGDRWVRSEVGALVPPVSLRSGSDAGQ